jgi:hypothetical protein
VTLPPLPPTFLEVARTANGIRTSFRPDTENAVWTHFMHDDVFDEDACGDMSVAPDGIMRSLAVIRPDTAPRQRVLVIRTGLGPSNWSTTFTTALTPDSGATVGNTPQCTPLRMARMRDGLHAIIWTNPNTDSLFNAVYNSNNPQTLAFGTTIRRPIAMGNVSPRLMSLAFFNNEVLLTWTDEAGQRINTLRGTISASGITFNTGVSSTTVAHEESSDVVVDGDTMFIALRTATGVALHRRRASNLPYTVQTTCTGSNPFRGRLLFRDAENVWWIAESAMPQNSTNLRLRSFSDCSTRDMVHPLGIGQLYHHPGRP